jgi:uncharacterized protein (UPF0335 family)
MPEKENFFHNTPEQTGELKKLEEEIAIAEDNLAILYAAIRGEAGFMHKIGDVKVLETMASLENELRDKRSKRDSLLNIVKGSAESKELDQVRDEMIALRIKKDFGIDQSLVDCTDVFNIRFK